MPPRSRRPAAVAAAQRTGLRRTGSPGRRAPAAGGRTSASVSASSACSKWRTSVQPTSATAATSIRPSRPSVTGPVAASRGLPSMEVQVKTGRMSSGMAPDQSATRAAIVAAPPAYASSPTCGDRRGPPGRQHRCGHLARDQGQHHRQQPQQPPRDRTPGQRGQHRIQGAAGGRPPAGPPARTGSTAAARPQERPGPGSRPRRGTARTPCTGP